MGEVWALIEQHRDGEEYRPSIAAIAEAAGMKRNALNRWQSIRRLPDAGHLQAVARQIRVPYRVLLEAALRDAGYLPHRLAPAQETIEEPVRLPDRAARQPRPGPDPS